MAATGFQYTCTWCPQEFSEYAEGHIHQGLNFLEPGDPKVIKEVKDLPEFDDEFLAVLKELGDGSYLMGNHQGIAWDRFYEMMETMYGWDMQDFEGSADEKIRRVVRKMVREGEIS